MEIIFLASASTNFMQDLTYYQQPLDVLNVRPMTSDVHRKYRYLDQYHLNLNKPRWCVLIFYNVNF